ncbi:MFS transporter [Desulfuribacillus alkaliarsenatis]|uniref:Nitrate/nitrite transporter n=1 Tax=Desulfuribacillus alkaliarsenatis TaxID=766136 RepID=A0A1E5G293_9FIRM|nr:MFS transporter [Desulfuribacillus alkaliarsenatis]OEF97023.1 nitrate/nitrite transporter [Desulfuribacillus alkaliarsenatis]
MARITKWEPEDEQFWEQEGKRHAYRNLWISVPALMLAFAVWQVWSVVAASLNDIGFNFTQSQLFTLAALPGLTGASLRLVYTFVVPIFGGRNWTVISTASLLIPAIGIGFAVQNPDTSFMTMAILAALCGLGGGNFASSMSNISFFFPKKAKGTALGINGGIGNLGVSLVQLLAPIVITVGIFGAIVGSPQILPDGTKVWMQNAAFVWVIPIVATAIAAYFGMDNLPNIRASVREQAVVLKNKHTWLMTSLYVMCFGSFIGYAAAFPLVIRNEFPEINVFHYAFLGPLVGALIRPFGGWMADKIGGALVTFVDTIIMIIAAFGAIYFLSMNQFAGFLIMFIILFAASGVANGSTFGMIPNIFPGAQAAAVIGFSSAIAAYGGFFVPKLFGWAIGYAGTISIAMYLLIAYYFVSLFITWFWYLRKY